MASKPYRRTMYYCATCKRRPSLAEREVCERAGHEIHERKSKRWTIQYKSGGQLQTQTFKHFSDAEKALTAVRAAIDKGARPGKITFDEAMQMVRDNYTLRGYRSIDLLNQRIAKHLSPKFAGWQMAQLTSDVLSPYAADLTRAGAAAGTVRAVLAIVSRGFTLAMGAGKLMARPKIEKPPAADPRQGFFEDKEFDGIVKHLPKEMRPIAEFLRITGWRIREVLGLTWDRVDDRFIYLYPKHTKSKKGRKFPVTAEIQRVIGKRGSGLLFPIRTKEGDPYWTWQYAWKAAREAAGLPSMVTHDLRRTGVRRAVRAGVSERVAMKLSGHVTRRIFDAYNITSDDDLEAAGKALDLATAQSTAHKGRSRSTARKQA